MSNKIVLSTKKLIFPICIANCTCLFTESQFQGYI